MKKLLLKFIRTYYNPNEQYIEPLIKKWNKALVTWFMYVFVNGLIGYLVLSGIVFIFPKTNAYIFVGSEYWHILVIIIYSGLIIWFFQEIYKWKNKYKKGGKSNQLEIEIKGGK